MSKFLMKILFLEREGDLKLHRGDLDLGEYTIA
jgi:hypothetical protein